MPAQRSYDDAKLPANQEKALVALLATPTVKMAAERCSLNERTVRRYLKGPEFKARYVEERALLVEQSVAALQKAGTEAVVVLQGALAEEENVYARIRAARTILELMFRGTDLLDIVERVERLEEEADEQGW
jgi:hypothetical protein